MKTTFSFGLIVAAAGILACSDEGAAPRQPVGSAGSAGSGTAGTGTGGTGTAGTGTGGNAGSAAGGAGGTGSIYMKGPALTLNADGTVIDSAGNTTIDGAAGVVPSPMNPPVSGGTRLTDLPADYRDGLLCMNGATAQVLMDDYTNYWGAGLYVDLKQGPVDGAVVADAGAADAGDVPTEAKPWDPALYNVIGWSFKLVGQDSAIGPEAGVPPEMRLQARPSNAPDADSACANLPAIKNNTTVEVLFDNMFFECYNNPPGPGIFVEPLRINPANTMDYTKTIENIGFQVNASNMLAYQFNFCVTEIQPILGSN
jgi:hypothetical protein